MINATPSPMKTQPNSKVISEQRAKTKGNSQKTEYSTSKNEGHGAKVFYAIFHLAKSLAFE